MPHYRCIRYNIMVIIGGIPNSRNDKPGLGACGGAQFDQNEEGRQPYK